MVGLVLVGIMKGLPNVGRLLLLVVIGFVLIALEVFIIGGVLGVLGGICLLGAGAIGFELYGFTGGMLSLLALMLGTCGFLFTWIRVFPRTKLGKTLTLKQNIDEEKGVDSRSDLLDQTGTATTDLRPSGLACINDARVDVEAQSGWIDKGTAIQVIQVEGIRVVVRKL